MIHIYTGDGKGKTTAAMGLALRCAGSGMRVLVTQFFKNGVSGEVKALSSVPGVDYRCVEEYFGRFSQMTEEEKTEASDKYHALLESCMRDIDSYDMLVLDEVVSAYRLDFVDREKLLEFLGKNKDKEIILTGRDPSPELCELADYITEMKKIRHPYDKGIRARRGIEF